MRIALGAPHGDVLRLIFKSGSGLVGSGFVVGLLASLAAARLLAGQVELFQVKSSNPVSFLGVVVVLVLVAAAACLVPTRRAANVNPMEALRYE